MILYGTMPFSQERNMVRRFLFSILAIVGVAQSAAAYETSGNGVTVTDIPGVDWIRYSGPTYSMETPDASMIWQAMGKTHRKVGAYVFYVHLELTYPVASADEKPWKIREVETTPSSHATHTATKPKLTCNPDCSYVEESNFEVLPYFLIESAGKPITLTIYTMAGIEKEIEIPAPIVDEFIAKMHLPTKP
jgi:hypothetical protein